MKKTASKRIVLFLIVSSVVTLSLIACSAKSAIQGRWVNSEEDSEMTFYNDGTFSSTSGTGTDGGTYSISNNQLKLSNGWTTLVFEYQIKGNELIMTDDNETMVFTKQDKQIKSVLTSSDTIEISTDIKETITVHVKIIGLNNEILSDRDVQLIDYPSNITAEYATSQVCSIEGIDFNYDPNYGAITQIGQYKNDDFNTTTEYTAVPMTGFFWQLIINGVEASSTTLLKDGDQINWNFVNFPIN